MNAMRTLGASVLVASGLLVAVQGCALFTCIEDDCDSLSSGSGGRGVGGAGPTTASTGMTTVNATSAGVGGSGGEAPCTEDCPICSEELEGNAISVAVFQDQVFVLVEPTGPTALFTLPIVPGGFGAAEPRPGAPYLPNGALAATPESVFYFSQAAFKDVISGQECDTGADVIGAAAAGDDLYFLHDDGLQTFDGCFEMIAEDDSDAAVSIAATSDRIVLDAAPMSTGPCFKLLPITVSTPTTCLPQHKPLAVSVSPSGKRILFRSADGVRSWVGDPNIQAELVADFGSVEEKGLPIAATDTEVFFARSGPAETMWRCQYAPPYVCRSIGTESVTSIHVQALSQTAYFTMGRRVCVWP